MRSNALLPRPLVLVLLASGVLAVSGCSWFHKGDRGDYALAPENRPLEVPPDLNLPNTDSAMKIPPSAPAAASAAPAAAASSTGFTVPAARDVVFGKVGEVLDRTEGVKVANRATLLGVYDLSYEGSDFLVRIVAVDAGSYVSAVDPRGLPAAGAAPQKLVGLLKAQLVN